MVLFLKSVPIFVINKNIGPLNYWAKFLNLRSMHLDLVIFCKAFKGLKPLSSNILKKNFLWACSTFSSRDLCTLIINYILRIMWSPMTSKLACASKTLHKPLRLLLMVSLGVQLMNTIKGKYFMLAWMPHWCPKNIHGSNESQFCMLVATINLSLCLMVFIRCSTMPLHWD